MTPRKHPFLVRSVAALALALAVPVGLTACRSAATGPGPSPTPVVGVGATWGTCMRDAGYDVPDPSDEQAAAGTVVHPDGVDVDAFYADAAECSAKIGVNPPSDADHQRWARQYEQVASCIREHGFEDFPEQREGSLDISGYARSDDPAFEEAFQACLAEFAPDTKQSTGQPAS